MLRQVAEAVRRRKYAQDAFNRYQRDGLNPAWISCGFCSGQTIFLQAQFRQHICCVMCGAQMIATRKMNQRTLTPMVVMEAITPGPPYREWSWDP
jgi:hypothetical protein